MIYTANIRVERSDVIKVLLVDGSRDINDVAVIQIENPNHDQVSLFFPYEHDYDPMRMTLGEFADKMTAVIEEAFELREGARQRREEAEEERHEQEAPEED